MSWQSSLTSPSTIVNRGGNASTFTVNEVVFLAENELVTIVPNFKLSEIELIDSSTYGPFRPAIPVQVPLWLALHLKRSKRCQIQPPDWMDTSYLSEVFRLEKEETKTMQKLPYHYLEISQLLLTYASDDIADSLKVRGALKDVEDVRSCKLNSILQKLNGFTAYLKLNDVSAMELHSIRELVLTALNSYTSFNNAEQGIDPNTPQVPTSTTTGTSHASSSSSSSSS